jgi:hypothetical protein
VFLGVSRIHVLANLSTVCLKGILVTSIDLPTYTNGD